MQKDSNSRELLKQIEELKNEIKNLKSRKKYGLVWEDKPEQVVLDCQSKLPILKEVKNKEIKTDKNSPVNILIEGDNYHSLSVLNYTHKGRVDVIYIDPPYNTGNKDFKYNDHYIDKEDSYRHSKWISFMNKRLRLAHNLLKSTGVIFISIDDNEQVQLKMLCDEVFGLNNFISTVIWNKKNVVQNDARFFSTNHEYLHCYAKDINCVKFNLLPRTQKLNSTYKNIDNDPKGSWVSVKMDAKSGSEKSYYEVKFPNGIKWKPTAGRYPAYTKENLLKFYKEGRLWFGKNGKNIPRRKVYLSEVKQGMVSNTIFLPEDVGSTQLAKQTLVNIIDKNIFETPKPVKLIKKIVRLNGDKNNVIVDFMAGSGTTGHAVLELNKEDGGNRKFILCTNNENKIAEDVCYPRISKVIKGYKNKKGEKVEGLGGGLKYYKTDFVDSEHINKISDDSKIRLTYQVGEMIALREDTLDEVEKNEWWQIFTDGEKQTAIYFKEDKSKLQKLVDKLSKNKSVLYIFSWGKNEYKNEFLEYKNLRIEDIPEPIIEVYKELNKL